MAAMQAGAGVVAKAAAAQGMGTKVLSAKAAKALAGKGMIVKSLDGQLAFAALGNNPVWFNAAKSKAAAAKAVKDMSIEGIRMKKASLVTMVDPGRGGVAAKAMATKAGAASAGAKAAGAKAAGACAVGGRLPMLGGRMREAGELKTMVGGRMVEMKGAAAQGAMMRGGEMEGMRAVALKGANAEGLKTAVATKGVTPMVKSATAGGAKVAATKSAAGAAAGTIWTGKGLSLGLGLGLGAFGPLILLSAAGAAALGIYGYRQKRRDAHGVVGVQPELFAPPPRADTSTAPTNGNEGEPLL